MSKYKGQLGGKKGKKKSGKAPPPLFGQCPKENVFSYKRFSLTIIPDLPGDTWQFRNFCDVLDHATLIG